MGVNVLGARKTRAATRAVAGRAGEPVVWAWVQSHWQSGRWARVTTVGHRHGWWDRRTGTYEPDEATGMDGGCSSSCRTLFEAVQGQRPSPEEVQRRADEMRRNFT